MVLVDMVQNYIVIYRRSINEHYYFKNLIDIYGPMFSITLYI